VRYAAEAPAEAKKKMIDQHSVCADALSRPCWNLRPVMNSSAPDPT
jgi:hypothetical protein